MDLEKKLMHMLLILVKEWISQNDLMWSFNFEGDKLYLNLIKKTRFFGRNSIFGYIMAKFPTIQKIVVW